ncbi:MAG: RecQ family zinc-binding domain-containing protein, partial [Prevotellaceae bacterium]|jgi:ATP-dependent DNA helicase RecQ|nr:RecQ family zinc-binding domain-containing protein [Prevotellaceae bacterium]
VRWVVHVEMPDSLEAYYQEAGRAGRDELKAYAVLLYSNADKLSMSRRYAVAFPPIDEIKRVYQAVCTYLQVPLGAGRDTVHDFDLRDFCTRYRMLSLRAYSALQFLQRDGYLELTDEINNPSRLMFTVDRDQLYKVQLAQPTLDLVIKALLRAYTGLFSQFANIDEGFLARPLGLTHSDIYDALRRLTQLGVAAYVPRKKTPLLILTEERLDDKSLRITKENYADRRARYVQRTEAMLAYATDDNTCRSRQLLAYFGQTNVDDCGQCDVCLARHEIDMPRHEFHRLRKHIASQLTTHPQPAASLVASLSEQDASKLLGVLRWMMDGGEVRELDGLLRIKNDDGPSNI